jgi:hypothetical protein
MVQPVTVGLDIAKNVFHAYGVDAHGEKVLSRELAARRSRRSLQSSNLASSASRPARPRIIGPARSRSWAIGSGSCRRHT